MAKGPAVEQTGEWYEQGWALTVVVLYATMGGIIVQILMYGLKINSGSVNFRLPSLPPCIKMPPLVGMIIFGCIARNFLCNEYMQHYPTDLAATLRIICLSVILLRGGLELDFAGKGLTMILLTVLPQLFEATAAACATHYILGIPWSLSFAHGFTLGAVSPAVVVPSMMDLHKQGYGIAKGIPTSMIAAASFDDIIAITAFGVFIQIAFNAAPKGVEAETGIYIGWEIGNNMIQLAIGLCAGLSLGFGLIVLQFIKNRNVRKVMKTIAVLVVAIAMPLVSEVLEIPEAKFVGIIFFGYGCFRVWGEDKPEKQLATVWMFCQPLLFGSVGAAVQFKDIQPSELGTGCMIIFIGLAFRWIGAFCACLEPKYKCQEKAFVAFGWIPKATVQAALGGVTLSEAIKRKTGPEYEAYGRQMLTMAVFAICITAPLGAIFIAQLGPRWLEKSDVPTNSHDDSDSVQEQKDDDKQTARNLAPTQNEQQIISADF